MGQDAAQTALKTSVLGTFRVLVVMLAGFLASKLPKHERASSKLPFLIRTSLLTRDNCRTLSRVCALLFLPALVVSSTGSTLTPSTLRDSWQLMLSGGFTIMLSFATAWVLGRAFLKPQDRSGFLPVQVAIAFPNAVAFPLLLMDSLCQQDIVNGDFDGDSGDCFTEATGMIFIYLVVWQTFFYGWGFHAIERNSTLEEGLAGSSAGSGASITDDESTNTQRTGLPSRTEDANDSDTRETMVINSKFDETFVAGAVAQGRGGPNPQDGSASQPSTLMAAGNVRGPPQVFQNQIVLLPVAAKSGGGEIVEVISDGRYETSKNDAEEAWHVVGGRVLAEKCAALGRWARRIFLSLNMIAVFLGIVISLLPWLQEMLFNNTQAALWPLGAALQTVGTPSVAVSTVVMAGSLVQVPMVTADANGERTWDRSRVLMGVLHVVCRLIAVPAVGFVVFWLTRTQTAVLGPNRLMHLIILIEFAMPSAALVIVSLNQLKMPATAGFLARLYIVQYGFSMFTISAWTAIALRMVY